MNLIEIKEVGFKAYMPECLSECSQHQYIMMSRLIAGYNAGEIKSLNQFYALAVYALLGIQPNKKQKNDQHWENLALLSTLVEPFFYQNEDKLQIVQDYTNNPIKSFWHNGLFYKGPADHFQDVTFGQYIDGLTKVIEFNEYGNVEDIQKLTAIFFQPSLFGIRANWGDKLVKKTAKRFKNLEIGIAYGFYLYFTSMNQFLTEATIPHEGRIIDLSIIFENNSEFKSDLPSLGMRSTLYDIAKSGVFGGVEEVRNTKFWEVIFRLYDLRKQDIDQKKYAEQQERKTKSP